MLNHFVSSVFWEEAGRRDSEELFPLFTQARREKRERERGQIDPSPFTVAQRRRALR